MSHSDDLCKECSGQLRLSHRQYRGRGESVAVYRCQSCGATMTRAASSQPKVVRSRKPPVDEGPPQNFVIDPGVAAKLLQQLKEETNS